MFRRVLAAAKRGPRGEQPTDYQSLEDASGGLDTEYRRLVRHHLQRWGVPETCAAVDIQQVPDEDGKQAFVAIVSLVAWNRNAVLRVLLGLPLLDKKIRKAADVSWLADVSVFKGVLLRASSSLDDPQAATELRQLVVTLTGPRDTYRRSKPDPATVTVTTA